MCCGSGRKADGEHGDAVRKHSIGYPGNRTQQPETDREWIPVPKPNATPKEQLKCILWSLWVLIWTGYKVLKLQINNDKNILIAIAFVSI